MNELTEYEMSSINGGGDGSLDIGEALQSIWMMQQTGRGVLPREQSGDLH